MLVYIAGGWFNLYQLKAVEEIESILKDEGTINFFSPRLHNKGDNNTDKDKWQSIYDTNIEKLNKCDIVIASTEDKDMGTLFECGYAASLGKKIVYYAPTLGTRQFNLMLAKSGIAVCTSEPELRKLVFDGFPSIPYTGGIE